MSQFSNVSKRQDLGKTLKRVTALVGSRFAGSFLTLLYTLIIARISDPESFGLAMFGLSFALLASIPLSLNVESASIKYLVRYKQDGDLALASGFLQFNRWLLLGVSGVAVLALTFALLVGVFGMETEAGRVFILSALTAPFLAATRVYGRHATALDEVMRGSLPRMLVRPALFCLVLGFMWLTGQRISAGFVSTVFLIATVFTALLQAWLLRSAFSKLHHDKPDLSQWRLWLQTGTMMAPMVLMRENLKDIIIVSAGLVLVKADLGLLALSLSILAIIIFAVKSVDIAVSPKLSKAIQAAHQQKAVQLIGTSGVLKLIGVIFGLGVTAFLGERLLGLFGTEYLPANMPVLILFAIPIANAVFGPVDLVLNVSGNQRAILKVSVVCFVLLVGGTVLGGWAGGLTGAALGVVLAYVLGQILMCLCCIRLAGLDPSVRSILSLQR